MENLPARRGRAMEASAGQAGLCSLARRYGYCTSPRPGHLRRIGPQPQNRGLLATMVVVAREVAAIDDANLDSSDDGKGSSRAG